MSEPIGPEQNAAVRSPFPDETRGAKGARQASCFRTPALPLGPIFERAPGKGAEKSRNRATKLLKTEIHPHDQSFAAAVGDAPPTWVERAIPVRSSALPIGNSSIRGGGRKKSKFDRSNCCNQKFARMTNRLDSADFRPPPLSRRRPAVMGGRVSSCYISSRAALREKGAGRLCF